jgi:hypothetical protein
MWTIVARGATNGAFTVLYPVPRDLETSAFRRLLADRLSGMTNEQVLHEFNEQLATLGGILQKKHKHCHYAAITLLFQVTTATASVLLFAAIAANKF